MVLVVNGRRDMSVESTADKIGEDLCLDTGDTRGRMCFEAHVYIVLLVNGRSSGVVVC
jgi:hypothetical protein